MTGAKPRRKRSPAVAPIDVALAEALISRKRPSTLLEIEAIVKENSALLDHLAERANQEQGWFWGRFAAFATLHAGFFVLITSSVFQGQRARYMFSVGGAILGASWFVVQLRSLSYVMKTKAPYHNYRVLLGLNAPEDNRFRLVRWITSSTFIGVFTSGVVVVAWLVAAYLLGLPSAP